MIAHKIIGSLYFAELKPNQLSIDFDTDNVDLDFGNINIQISETDGLYDIEINRFTHDEYGRSVRLDHLETATKDMLFVVETITELLKKYE